MNKLLILLTLIFILSSCAEDRSASVDGPLFERVDESLCGINFSNTLTPDVATKFNLLDFDYYYNGAGVGVGDINNDGLQDIFFAANEVDNKLYLNKGDLKFEDISDAARINANKHWANGVSMADVNGDGWLDIYVSQGGPHISAERRNVLYINNQDLTFTERASEYGLADSGISTQSAFFDYDKDGDLDCIVMNESLVYGYDPTTFHRLLIENEDQVYESYSHLYRNDKGKYVDVTREAGMTAPTFGLGLVVSDINEDGWLDIYIANDYYQPDNVYINRKNGTFADRAKIHLKQTSFYGMGADIADINNDGHQDIFVLDMASKDHIRSKTLMASMDTKSFDLLVNQFGFLHQYMFNSLQLNDGQGRFKNIAQMAGVANTDWSWASIIEDFDNDGYRDILVTNGYRKYGTDNDFKSRVTAAKVKYKGDVPLEVKRELYESMPSEALANQLFKNGGGLRFEEVGEAWGLGKLTFSNGAASADLDNDGDLDLIINNMDGVADIYRNTASARDHNYLNVDLGDLKSSHAKVEITSGATKQIAEVKSVRGYMSSLQPIAHFGLGDMDRIDELVVTMEDGSVWKKSNVKVNQTIVLDRQNVIDGQQAASRERSMIQPVPALALGLGFVQQENEYDDFAKEILLPYKQSTHGPIFAKADINSDDIDDIYIGAPSGQSSQLYLSTAAGYELVDIAAFRSDAKYEDAAACFLDIDVDGDQDLIVLSGGNASAQGHEIYNPRVYINNGVTWTKSKMDLSTYAAVGGSLAAIDYDEDGDDDLIIGNRIIPQLYPQAGRSYLLRNDGGSLVDVTDEIAPAIAAAGIVNDIAVLDLDDDGDLDIAIAAEWEAPMLLMNQGGKFVVSKSAALSQLRGLYFSVTPTDINGDGLMDLVYGNIGDNFKLSASVDKPLMVYADDFDDNGTHDLVLTKTYQGEYVPVRGRECSSQQMPFIVDKFETYEKFANSTLTDIYGADNLADAYMKDITTRRSYILINQGEMRYEVQELPVLAQTHPMLAVTSTDINKDGLDDLISMGTIYDMEVETPRLDAGSGLIMLSDGAGYVSTGDSNYALYIDGDIKSSEVLKRPDGQQYVVIGRINAALGLLKLP